MAVLSHAQRALLVKEFGKAITANIYKARKELIGVIDDHNWSLDNYGILNGKGIITKLRSACLYGMPNSVKDFYENYGDTEVFINFNTGRARGKVLPEKEMDTILTYITWLANDSQYSKLFIIKDAKDIWNKGFLLRTKGFSPAFVSQASIHMRWISEQYDRITENWPLLMDQIPLNYPYNGNLATYFLLAAHLDVDGDWFMSKQDLGHSIFNHSTLTKKGLTNLVLGKDVEKANMANSGVYAPLIGAWQDGGAGDRVDQRNSPDAKKAAGNPDIEKAYADFGTPKPLFQRGEHVGITKEGASQYFKTFINNNFTPKFIKKIGGLTV